MGTTIVHIQFSLVQFISKILLNVITSIIKVLKELWMLMPWILKISGSSQLGNESKEASD